ncbi:hypothetical protein LEL_08008 [Akanthomyces lecanii RCEF 1005]|uniref:RNA helicase HEL117-like protein n=1 Tax=Akanthomyces lecanii RCEF 1005 TaxID=1081108 RepID=A0A168EYY1_CORDF|nr:hypothetical protein LEL_08008 [Akanthomyces lecanii RCEF 1005]
MPGPADERSRATRETDDSRRHRDRRSRSPDHKRRRRSEDTQHERRGPREHKSDGKPSTGRIRSPRRHHEHHRRRERDSSAVAPATLPFDARPLTKGDLRKFEPLLASYLDLQKQKYIEDMDDREVRGRWKSFIGKWNRGELAEGWYDPDMFQRIVASHSADDTERASRPEPARQDRRHSPVEERRLDDTAAHDNDDSDSDYGPTLPSSCRGGTRMGVAIPSKDDLALRDELRAEDRDAARDDLRADRRADRKRQKEQLDELVPRAEAGTRERKLEKKREVNDKMRQFREGSPGGSMAAAHDSELMGGGDSVAELRQRKEEDRRRKTEREIRREELQRAKQEEIEEKRRKWQEREQGTMSMLQELARQRFGPGS